jgi:uncharacterized membrane protein YphA (DoxX/SURF4 family)
MSARSSNSALGQIGTLGARFILGLIFALSAATKLSAPGIFQADVAAYHLLPDVLVTPFAVALPWIEGLLALYLILGLFLRPTALVVGALLLTCTGALTLNILSGNVAHGCGCLQTVGLAQALPILTWLFGGLTITWFDVGRDLVLTALAAVMYVTDAKALSLDGILFADTGRDPASADFPRSTEAFSRTQMTEVD